MVRQSRSVVWKHFSKTECGRFVVCRWCQHKLSILGITSNMLYHLKHKHPELGMEEAYRVKRKHPKLEMQEADFNIGQLTAIANQIKLEFHDVMTAFKKEKITDLITDFIVKDMRPITVVEGEHFKRLISHMEPKYTVPSSRTFAQRIEKMFCEAKTDLQADLSVVKCLALSFDAWTSISMEAYLGVTAHFIDKSFNFQSHLLGCKPVHERHTADNMAFRIEEVLKDFKIDPSIVSGVVSVNCSDMKAAKQILNTKFGWYSVGCTAHSLQLCLNHGLQLPSLQKLLRVVKQVINHFDCSELATSALKKKCEEMQLTFKTLDIDISMSWNSIFLMMQRLVEMQWPVMAVLNDQDVISPSKAKTLSLKSADWDLMRRLIPVFEPFAEVMNLLGAEKFVSVSSRNPYTKGLRKHLQRKACEDSGAMKQFCGTIIEEMTSQFESVAVGVTWKATALDPRYKLRGLGSVEATRLRSALEVELAQSVASEDHPPSLTATDKPSSQSRRSSALKNLVDMAFDSPSDASGDVENDSSGISREISEYLSEKRIPVDENPLEWWDKCSGRFPNLAKLAVKFLCIPASSTTSEMVFSTTGAKISSLRTGLTGKHVEALLFCKYNG